MNLKNKNKLIDTNCLQWLGRFEDPNWFIGTLRLNMKWHIFQHVYKSMVRDKKWKYFKCHCWNEFGLS